jgi:15-cis-phytoene synthase
MPDPAAAQVLATSYAWCRASTRRHAKSFFFSSFPLPAARRRAAYAVYAFCRHADDLVDEAPPGTDLGPLIAGLAATFDRILAGHAAYLPFAPAFADTVRRYGLEVGPFAELVTGVARDQGPVRIPDWPALRDYCYHVASTVGLILCPVFGLSDPAGRERAIDLGIAMQLTNIIRDVGEDLRRDRIYLPADELAAAGINEDDLRAAQTGSRWQSFLADQIARAREFYHRAEPGIALLAPDGSRLTVWLMREIYADILRAVEANHGDVFNRRAHTSLPRKLRLAWRAWRKARHP